MLQLLKIVFTFGKELLIALCQSGSFKLTKRSRGYKPLGLRLAFLQPILCPKNERQKGKRRILGCKMKYWMENIWKKHQHFLVRTAERENNKRCRRIFLHFHIKDKTGVLTCGQLKSVNNHSELNAELKSRSRHFTQKYCLAKQIQIRRGLDIFSLTVTLCYFPSLPRKLLQ